MAQAVIAFQPNDYLLWWYNVNYLTRWPQLAAPSAGFTVEYTEQKEEGGMGGQTIGVLKYRNDIANYIATTGKTEYHAYEAVCNVLSVYLGIFDTDLYGDRPYTEACHYADQGILTPKYDNVEDLYKLWLTELDQPAQAWTDIRRTGFPILSYPEDTDQKNAIYRNRPNRVVWPATEQANNAANYAAAAKVQEDKPSTKLFWAK